MISKRKEDRMKSNTRVCVVGAGPSGIAAGKNCVEYGLDVVIFEKTIKLAGTGFSTPKPVIPASTKIPTSSVLRFGPNMKTFQCPKIIPSIQITNNFKLILNLMQNTSESIRKFDFIIPFKRLPKHLTKNGK